MRIGELARRTGVSERSLRCYEEQGLLTAERTRGGHRDYPDAAVDRVIRIQELFAAGLHSSKIAAASLHARRGWRPFGDRHPAPGHRPRRRTCPDRSNDQRSDPLP
jgi:DNA-binding transcriptional MerR regulator